ncbi:hypothetical protein NDU88_006309 [Pleurodeles waltl]|uniref:Transmembrane protein n=1 Tax=Pleurodeles waltl TaxID=8319 RepID=A0AAV7TWU6_PLEWA|nr:hypothetical protein NDU88_006309 [Pleurodeles waltl]
MGGTGHPRPKRNAAQDHIKQHEKHKSIAALPGTVGERLINYAYRPTMPCECMYVDNARRVWRVLMVVVCGACGVPYVPAAYMLIKGDKSKREDGTQRLVDGRGEGGDQEPVVETGALTAHFWRLQ